MLAIIIGISLFMLLVIIHELGHFIAAKKSGIKVLEFGIGIPPKIFTYYKDKSGTEYTINWLPLGGFVRLKGENPDEPEVFFAKDSFITASFWKKIVVLFGGVTMNLIFAWIFFTIAFWKGITPLQVLPVNLLGFESQSYIMPSYEFLKSKGLISGDVVGIPVEIDMIMPGSIAQKFGLQTGDIINKIDNIEINSNNISQVLKNYLGKSFELEYTRSEIKIDKIKNTETEKYKDTKPDEINYIKNKINITCPNDNCLLGIIMGQGGKIEINPIKFGLLEAMGAGMHEISAQTHITAVALSNLFKNLLSFDKERVKQSVEKMSGPVGAVKVGDMILNEFGIWMYIAFGGMISLALAIFNVLPIPALDGGRALGVVIQSLFRLPAEKYFNIENYFNVFFFVILMGLGVYIILLDLYRFWGVNIPFLG